MIQWIYNKIALYFAKVEKIHHQNDMGFDLKITYCEMIQPLHYVEWVIEQKNAHLKT